MQVEQQTAGNADAAAAAAATTPQPGVPRYVVPPATGDLAYGRSHWDRKPAEIHAMILKHAGPPTLFLNGLLGDAATLSKATKLQLWADTFQMDWQGDLALLPDVKLTTENGLLLAHSRSMYDRLCKRFPKFTEVERAIYDKQNNRYCGSFRDTCRNERRLLLIAMRHGWYDLLDFSKPIALARMAIRFGFVDLLKHLDDKYKILQRWMAKQDPSSEYWHEAILVAARYGHLDVVQYLFDAGVTGCTVDAMDWAAENGHFHVVKWFHENRTEGCTTWSMNAAAGNGHLHIVKWLHKNRTEGCTEWAMDWAAIRGHLHIVKWLHENRTEGCTTEAMDKAAENGHLHIVKWLHANRTEGCTTHAMDWAAVYGHLHVVKWLHANRTEGCTDQAMIDASTQGRVDMVEWLHETRGQECTSAALDNAVRNGHVDVVKYMHSRGSRASNNAIDSAAAHGNAEMVQYLLDHGYGFGLEALHRARTAEVADILLGSITLDRAQTLLAEAKQGFFTNKTTIERLESTIRKRQPSSE